MQNLSHTQTSGEPVSILVVEDDETTRDTLVEGLRLYGYNVIAAGDCSTARRALSREPLDAILLDVELPDESGFALLREIRTRQPDEGTRPDVPILMLSGHGREEDRVRGFELGCDDYVVKPYSFNELRGRLTASLRRVGAATGELQRIGDLVIDHRAHTAHVAGEEVSLTQKEWGLLIALAADPTRVFTRQQLLRTVWGYRSAGSTRTLDAHACRLRAKLSRGNRRFLVNVWGVGYRLVDPRHPDLAEERQS
ncbi:MAG: response regulator transcription factor [Actinobacteria bacterium]|nr:response regulator transcription factor [Actinomycetota bacterium]